MHRVAVAKSLFLIILWFSKMTKNKTKPCILYSCLWLFKTILKGKTIQNILFFCFMQARRVFVISKTGKNTKIFCIFKIEKNFFFSKTSSPKIHVFKRLLLFRPENNKLNKNYFVICLWYLAWNSFKFSPKFRKKSKSRV